MEADGDAVPVVEACPRHPVPKKELCGTYHFQRLGRAES